MSEHDEQAALIKWADMIPEITGRLYAIPNGTHKRPAAAAKFKREGLRRGYPDLGLDMARRGYNGLRIEMKAKGKYPTPEQREWLTFLNENGYYAVWTMGWISASDVIRFYIGMTDEEPKKRKI